MSRMCLNSHTVKCFLCPLTCYMHSINIYGGTHGSHFRPCLLSLLPYVSPYHHLLFPTLFTSLCPISCFERFSKDSVMTLHWFPVCSCALSELVCRVMMVPDLAYGAWHYSWTVSPLNKYMLSKAWENKQWKNLWEYKPQGFYVFYGPFLLSKNFCIKQKPISLQNFILTF